jgi:beta-lactam-binding protein with PASTA domain
MGLIENIQAAGDWLERYHLKRVTIILLGFIVFALIVDNIVMPLVVRLGQSTTVPAVTGMTLAEAENFLQKNGFKVVLEGEKYDRRYPPGYVVSQNPPKGSEVKRGRRIYVMTSMGEKLVQVPDLRGRSERDAQFIVKSSQLILDHVSYEYSSYYLEGTVADQSIKEAKEVKVGTPISIIISLGLSPDRFLVPDVRGKDLEAAQTRIRKSGLTIGIITYQVEPDLLPNTVISQSIDPETEVGIGTSIDLIVSQISELGPEDLE